MSRFRAPAAPLCLLLLSLTPQAARSVDWSARLKEEISRIDARTPGGMGVYVRRLRDGTELDYQARRKWYLSSTVKVLVAIAVLEKVEEGSLSLDEVVTLRASDYVDGTGALLWRDPGARFTLNELLERMLLESDSTAADLLIRRIGVRELNIRIREKMRIPPDGFSPLTTLLQVRHDAYAELHPRARELSNMDFIELKQAKGMKERLEAFLSKLGIGRSELKAASIEAGFERYYERGLNSGSLVAFGGLLARLERGELLSPTNTERILSLMERMVTGERRIKAGLPRSLRFAQKTGTQVRRICNVGILRPISRTLGGEDSIVVAACLEKFTDPSQAERALEELGRRLGAVFGTPDSPDV